MKIVAIRSKLNRFRASRGYFPRDDEFGKRGLPTLAFCATLLKCEPSREAILSSTGIDPFEWHKRIASTELAAHSTRWPNKDYIEGDELEPRFVYCLIFGKENMEEVYAAIGIDPPPRPQGE